MNGPLPVDDLGWRIPRAGTDARKVYDLMRAGLGCTKIARHLGKPRSTVGVLMHRIRKGRASQSRANDALPQRQQSVYVRKLVDILRMPLAEAIEIERIVMRR
jgi:IS30 family transposase